MKNERLKTIVYWVTTVLGPASFAIGGFVHISHGEQAIEVISHLGYPLYFASILGLWEILGAIAIVIPRFPRLKEWAYAGFVLMLTSAAVSHALSGDSLATIVQPLVYLALVIASWALRSPSRKLKAN